jgi:hypothetical protein
MLYSQNFITVELSIVYCRLPTFCDFCDSFSCGRDPLSFVVNTSDGIACFFVELYLTLMLHSNSFSALHGSVQLFDLVKRQKA